MMIRASLPSILLITLLVVYAVDPARAATVAFLPGITSQQASAYSKFDASYDPQWHGGGPVIGRPSKKPTPRTYLLKHKSAYTGGPQLGDTMRLLDAQREISTRARAIYDVGGVRYFGENWLTRHTSDLKGTSFTDQLARQGQVLRPGGQPVVQTRSYADIRSITSSSIAFNVTGRVLTKDYAPGVRKQSRAVAVSRSVDSRLYRIDGRMYAQITGHVASTKSATAVFSIYDVTRGELVYQVASRKGQRIDFELEGNFRTGNEYLFTVEAVSQLLRVHNDTRQHGGAAEFAVNMRALPAHFFPPNGVGFIYGLTVAPWLSSYSAIPEPGALLLFAALGPMLLRRRRAG